MVNEAETPHFAGNDVQVQVSTVEAGISRYGPMLEANGEPPCPGKVASALDQPGMIAVIAMTRRCDEGAIV